MFGLSCLLCFYGQWRLQIGCMKCFVLSFVLDSSAARRGRKDEIPPTDKRVVERVVFVPS